MYIYIRVYIHMYVFEIIFIRENVCWRLMEFEFNIVKCTFFFCLPRKMSNFCCKVLGIKCGTHYSLSYY